MHGASTNSCPWETRWPWARTHPSGHSRRPPRHGPVLAPGSLGASWAPPEPPAAAPSASHSLCRRSRQAALNHQRQSAGTFPPPRRQAPGDSLPWPTHRGAQLLPQPAAGRPLAETRNKACVRRAACLSPGAARRAPHHPRPEAAVPASRLPALRLATASAPARSLRSYPSDSLPAAHGGRAWPCPAPSRRPPPSPGQRSARPAPSRPASRPTWLLRSRRRRHRSASTSAGVGSERYHALTASQSAPPPGRAGDGGKPSGREHAFPGPLLGVGALPTPMTLPRSGPGRGGGGSWARGGPSVALGCRSGLAADGRFWKRVAGGSASSRVRVVTARAPGGCRTDGQPAPPPAAPAPGPSGQVLPT